MKDQMHLWTVPPFTIVLLLGAIVGYLFYLRHHRAAHPFLFAVGMLVMIVCLCSPLQLLAMHYLFSAHMLVHVMLLLLAGPFFILSLSSTRLRGRLGRLFDGLRHRPLAGWLAGVGIMWFWHIPAVFRFAMNTSMSQSADWAMAIEALSLVVAGMLFSAPVLHPCARYRMEPLPAVVYLFSACVACSLMGVLITFGPTGVYHHFLSHHDGFGWNNSITQRWHMTEAADQQTAGLIMWVPCCFVYVTGSLFLLGRWLSTRHTDTALPSIAK